MTLNISRWVSRNESRVRASPFGPGCRLRGSPCGSSPSRASIPDAMRLGRTRARSPATLRGNGFWTPRHSAGASEEKTAESPQPVSPSACWAGPDEGRGLPKLLGACKPLAAVSLTQRSGTHALQWQAGDRKSVDYCMTIVSQFLAKLLAANRSLSHANRVSGRSFPRSGETVFGRQRQKAPNCL
jgi:hypothetical protein